MPKRSKSALYVFLNKEFKKSKDLDRSYPMFFDFLQEFGEYNRIHMHMALILGDACYMYWKNHPKIELLPLRILETNAAKKENKEIKKAIQKLMQLELVTSHQGNSITINPGAIFSVFVKHANTRM